VGRIGVMDRRGRTHKQPLDHLKGKRGYWEMKEEGPNGTPWSNRFVRGCGPVARQTME
jgi:hypothetical protein